METKKTLTISLEKAKELYKNGSEDMKSLLLETFEKKELETQELPKTWIAYCENNYRIGYYLDHGSYIGSFDESVHNNKLRPTYDKNTLESEENAEAILALCQLIRLRDEYNGHRPIDYENKYPYNPHAIVYDLENNYYTLKPISKYSKYYTYKHLFVFHSIELGKEFLKNFRPLLDKFYKIMY